MGAGLAVPALTHDAPMGAWVALDGRLPERHDAPNVPTWENTDRTANRAGCVTPARMAGIPSHLLVSSREGVTRRVQWTPAVDRHLSRVNNNTRTDDDTFVIGLCVTQ